MRVQWVNWLQATCNIELSLPAKSGPEGFCRKKIVRIRRGKRLLYIGIPAIALAAYYALFWSSALALINSISDASSRIMLGRAATYSPLVLVPSGTILVFLTKKLLSFGKHTVKPRHHHVESHVVREVPEPVRPEVRVTVPTPSANRIRAKTIASKMDFSRPNDLLAYFYGEKNER